MVRRRQKEGKFPESVARLIVARVNGGDRLALEVEVLGNDAGVLRRPTHSGNTHPHASH